MKDFWKLSHKTPWKSDLYNQYSEDSANIPPPLSDFLLQENGDFLLQEDGGRIKL